MTVLVEKYNLEVHYNDFLRKTESGKMSKPLSNPKGGSYEKVLA